MVVLGQSVRVIGLLSREGKEMNGKQGRVTAVSDSGRYTVALNSGGEFKLKPRESANTRQQWCRILEPVVESWSYAFESGK